LCIDFFYLFFLHVHIIFGSMHWTKTFWRERYPRPRPGPLWLTSKSQLCAGPSCQSANNGAWDKSIYRAKIKLKTKGKSGIKKTLNCWNQMTDVSSEVGSLRTHMKATSHNLEWKKNLNICLLCTNKNDRQSRHFWESNALHPTTTLQSSHQPLHHPSLIFGLYLLYFSHLRSCERLHGFRTPFNTLHTHTHTSLSLSQKLKMNKPHVIYRVGMANKSMSSSVRCIM
jgi:hypothetical protein